MSLSTTVVFKHDLSLLFYTLCFATLVSFANVVTGAKCDAPPKINNATYEDTGLRYKTGRYKEGSVVNYLCNVGFTKGKDSSGVFRCFRGMWRGDADHFRCCKVQICIDPELFCVLPNVDNANPYFSSLNSSFPIEKGAGTAYGIGTTVIFNCSGENVLRNGSTTGPFICMHGGRWSSNDFTKCDNKDCGPPPTVTHARAVKVHSSHSQEDEEIRGEYYYICEDGYEMASHYDSVICASDLTWTATVKFESRHFSYEKPYAFPMCIIPNDSYDYYDRSSYRYRRRRTWSPLENLIAVVVFIAIIAACVVSHRRRRARNRAMAATGATNTEYIGLTGYSVAPPPMTAGTPMFAPPPPQPGSYPTQFGMYPHTTHTLTPQPHQESGYLNGPPPSYGGPDGYTYNTSYTSYTNPSIPTTK